MYGRNAANVYQQNQILTASPKKLVSLLLEGCVKNLKLAEFYIDEHDYENANKMLVKAQDIISELNTTLNYEEGKEIAQSLNSLYEYMLTQLIQANIHKDVTIIQTCRKLIEELNETWNQI